jgi:cobyrinic acid a,c-diamide synthase
MFKPQFFGSIAIAATMSLGLSACGQLGMTNYTVEECAEVMTAYMEMDAIAMLTCRQYLDQVGQDQFNAEVEQMKAAVAEGRTMKSDLDAGISQFESDLGVEPR